MSTGSVIVGRAEVGVIVCPLCPGCRSRSCCCAGAVGEVDRLAQAGAGADGRIGGAVVLIGRRGDNDAGG